MRNLAYIVILFAIIDIAYMLFCPPFPPVKRSNEMALWRCIYYINHYTFLFLLSNYAYRKSVLRPDKVSALAVMIYSVGKGVFYLLLINKDLPTYISILNKKSIDIGFSILLWSSAVVIYYKNGFKRIITHERWFQALLDRWNSWAFTSRLRSSNNHESRT